MKKASSSGELAQKPRRLDAAPSRDDRQDTKPSYSDLPSQFELAQLAAVIASGPKRPSDPLTLVEDALRLWENAGRVLSIEGHVARIVKGLVVFDDDHWVRYCSELTELLDASNHLFAGSHHRDWADDAFRAAYHGGEIIQRAWIHRYPYSLREDHVLKELFPGTSETGKSRKRKLGDLIAYIRNRFGSEGTGTSEESHGWTIDTVERSILEVWQPLHFHDEDEDYREELERTWSWLSGSGKAPHSPFSFAPFVRWLGRHRSKQLSQSKSRNPGPK